MKILLAADANSIHTIRWAKALSQKGFIIKIFSFSDNKNNDFKNYPDIEVLSLGFSDKIAKNKLYKISYLTTILKLKQIIKNFKPDILHAHYASSYGTICALAGFNPFILSIWGSDVFLFPKKTIIHRLILKHNFKKADILLSTSKIMKIEANKYTNKKIEVTPFGIDLNIFKQLKNKKKTQDNSIYIGTIKSLEDVYGIDKLIRAFKIIKDRNKNLPIKLLIVGKGTKESALKKLVADLNLNNYTDFIGAVPNLEVPLYLNKLSVYVALSNSESFGVAILEASACQIPVVVSNIGGLAEVVDNEKTGFIVEKNDINDAADKIEELIFDTELRVSMGKEGRKKVEKYYDWNKNVDIVIKIYNKILNKKA